MDRMMEQMTKKMMICQQNAEKDVKEVARFVENLKVGLADWTMSARNRTGHVVVDCNTIAMVDAVDRRKNGTNHLFL